MGSLATNPLPPLTVAGAGSLAGWQARLRKTGTRTSQLLFCLGELFHLTFHELFAVRQQVLAGLAWWHVV